MFDVEHDLLLVSVVSDQCMDSVAVRYPANETRVGRERNDWVTLNAVWSGAYVMEEQGAMEGREKENSGREEEKRKEVEDYIDTQLGWHCYNNDIIMQTTYLRCLLKVSGSLLSKVLTSPNSCITLSSCLRSSWPFSKNIKSFPLLPAWRSGSY